MKVSPFVFIIPLFVAAALVVGVFVYLNLKESPKAAEPAPVVKTVLPPTPTVEEMPKTRIQLPTPETKTGTSSSGFSAAVPTTVPTATPTPLTGPSLQSELSTIPEATADAELQNLQQIIGAM